MAFNSSQRRDDNKPQKVGPILDILGRTLSRAEFELMIEQWKGGEREFRVENGFVITSYTPKT